MLKFAIIGPSTANTQDLCDAAVSEGHEALAFPFSKIIFKTSGTDFLAKIGNQNLEDFDAIIFRGYNDHIYEAHLLAKMMTTKNKIIIEETLAGNYIRGKMQQAERLIANKIKHPKTFQANNFDGWCEILRTMKFPVIAKPVMGRKGRGIQKLESIEAALKFFQENYKEYIVQEYYPITSDYRVFVVGGKVIGAFQRFIKEGQFKSNIHGTKAEEITVDAQMKKISVDAVDAMGYEVAGVDLFKYENKLYVLEVNVAPQWEKFKSVTGINPATDIVKYAIKKLKGNSNQL